MKFTPMLLATAALTLAACNGEKTKPVEGKGPDVTAAPVPPPANGDWSTVVRATPEGGFVMGNPNAKVKLVEYGSMTCPHCAEFEEKGGTPLVDNYVKKGWVSWEFRNFVRDPVDMTASLVARCAGEGGFFGLTRNFYANQKQWFEQLQSADQTQLQSTENMSAAQRFSTIANLAGFKSFAAMRGVPAAKLDACLADQKSIDQLVRMNSDAIAQYNIPGTPTFLINGNVVEETATWEKLEPAIKTALAG